MASRARQPTGRRCLTIRFRCSPATTGGRPCRLRTAGADDRNLVEKNIWIVWTLRALVNPPFGEILTFMVRTSLSKAFYVIHRFSEDLDITYDIRAIAPDLVAGNDGNDIPPTGARSSAGRGKLGRAWRSGQMSERCQQLRRASVRLA